jgi:hypothetical protein
LEARDRVAELLVAEVLPDLDGVVEAAVRFIEEWKRVSVR